MCNKYDLVRRGIVKVIYDNKIVIKVDVNTLQPYKSKFYIEGENIIYTRDLAYIEQISEKDYYDLDNEMDLKEVIELILNDYKLIEKYFLLGVEKNDIEISLTFHEKSIIEEQIVKIIKNGVFDDEVVMTYCKKCGTRNLVNIANREIYFKASGDHNFFEGDYKEFSLLNRTHM